MSLAKDANAKVVKKINPSVLEFQRAHFYGKNSNRVSAASFMRHKTASKQKISLVCWDTERIHKRKGRAEKRKQSNSSQVVR